MYRVLRAPMSNNRINVDPLLPNSSDIGYGVQRRISRCTLWTTSAQRLLFSSHSQTMMTVHPSSRNARSLWPSRLRFAAIFGSQKSAFVAGARPCRHVCPCQKHPWTNTTVLYFGNTRSGVPGSRLSPITYRNPRRCRALRNASSGFVSERLTRFISAERRSGDRGSISRAISAASAARSPHNQAAAAPRRRSIFAG